MREAVAVEEFTSVRVERVVQPEVVVVAFI